MEELLKILEELYSAQNNSEVYEGDDRAYFKTGDVTKEKAEGLCNDLLITENGACNWDNINLLRSNGYSVFAGERDSFGWLTGCVRKNGDSRILVYG